MFRFRLKPGINSLGPICPIYTVIFVDIEIITLFSTPCTSASPQFMSYCGTSGSNNLHVRDTDMFRIRILCLTPLSTIFQLYRSIRRKPPTRVSHRHTLSHNVVSSTPRLSELVVISVVISCPFQIGTKIRSFVVLGLSYQYLCMVRFKHAKWFLIRRRPCNISHRGMLQ